VLRVTGVATTLAAFGWGLMAVGFPLYALRTLHAGAHAGGYLWAALASGSIVGTFVLSGTPTLRRVGLSYGVLGVSALAWLLAHSLMMGITLVFLTGFLEGPAYSGTIALRQRHAPPALRAQVMTTLSGAAMVAAAAGAAAGGLIHRFPVAVAAFVLVNAVAAVLGVRSVS
jgi:MFS family permease